MGIKGLSKFLKEYIPSSIKTMNLSELNGFVIAIDANYFMYKYTISTDDYIKKFYSQYLHLIKFGIKPLYVFDGKPPCEKQKVIDKRKASNKKKNIEITNNNIKKLKEYFYNNDISYLACESEADFICSRLSQEGLIHGCISDDMDFLTLGCKYLYRDYFQYSGEIIEYNLDKIMKVFTRNELIDISIFLGCDYCDRVYDFVNRSIPINVYELFLEYHTLENVWKYLYSTDKFLFVDDEKEKIVQDKWPKAREILTNVSNFDFDKIKEKMVNILPKLKNNTEQHIANDLGFTTTKSSYKSVIANKTLHRGMQTNMFCILNIC
jgi:flap endonuclease-1